jgi:hypothetical protein
MYHIYSIIVISVLTISCINTRHIVNPRYGHKFEQQDSILIITPNSTFESRVLIEKSVYTALEHCKLYYLPHKNADNTLYQNLIEIDDLDFSDKKQLEQLQNLLNIDYLIVGGNNKTTGIQYSNKLWGKNNYSQYDEIAFGIFIYDLKNLKQVLSIEKKSTSGRNFGLALLFAAPKILKRSMKKLTEACKCLD